MTLARGATNHQHPESEKFRELSSDRIDCVANRKWNAFDQVLSDEKQWLNAPNDSGRIAQEKITMFEAIIERVLNNFVVAMILAAAGKSAPPSIVSPKLFISKDGGSAVREWKYLRRSHVIAVGDRHPLLRFDRVFLNRRRL
jgi:hypothetical protein